MAKRVFFSFHYQDVTDFRANVVRNHWMTKPNRDEAGFFDASVWEEAKKDSNLAIKRLINAGLTNTSSTCVLIGSQTYARPWVHYEIFKSVEKGNTVIGVHINEFKDKYQRIKVPGPNPFEQLAVQVSEDGLSVTPLVFGNNGWTTFPEMPRWKLGRAANPGLWGKIVQLSTFGIPTYRWVADDGYNNFASWVGE